MSMITSIAYGYGVDDETLSKVETTKLVEFLKKYLPNNYEEMMKEVKNMEDVVQVEGWLDECECSMSGMTGRYSIIANVLTEITELNFAYHRSPETNENAVMFESGLPWQYNEKEKNCSQEALDEIFKKYFKELGLDVEPTDVSVEYYG